LKKNAFEIDGLEKNGRFHVFGYKNELVHVLVNVISNAKDAINEQRARGEEKNKNHRIALSVHTTAETVVIKISDTGCGIPESLLPKILTPILQPRERQRERGSGCTWRNRSLKKRCRAG
jgi:signal transduction histidine kinase